jgi:peptide-methionine (S)-S-oxide reductase
VGYAGGTDPNPTYYALGDHTEVVQVEYDPGTLAYEDLLSVVWETHNWASNARKRQYRGVVLTHDEDQRRAVEQAREALADRTGRTVETDVEPLDQFALAESYHQKYELRSTPIVGDELLECCGDAFVDSTAAARLNGFVAGHGTDEHRRDLLAALDLSPLALDEVRRRVC